MLANAGLWEGNGEQPNCEVRSVTVVAGDRDWRVIVITVDGRLTSAEGIDEIGDELRGKYDLAHSNG